MRFSNNESALSGFITPQEENSSRFAYINIQTEWLRVIEREPVDLSLSSSRHFTVPSGDVPTLSSFITKLDDAIFALRCRYVADMWGLSLVKSSICYYYFYADADTATRVVSHRVALSLHIEKNET